MMKKSLHRLQAGFSLVELMVSLVVGSLLSLGLINVLINSNQSYRMQSALMQMQQEGQFAMDILTQDIRDTSFFGCLNRLDNISNHLNPQGANYHPIYTSFDTALDGEASLSGGAFVTGTDSITITAARNIGGGVELIEPFGPSSDSPLHVLPNTGITTGDIVLVSDCEQGDIFQITNANAQATGSIEHAAGAANANGSLSRVYNAGAFMLLPYTRTYSLRVNNEGNPALYVTDRTGTQELAEGVENLVILYGEDTNGNGTANRYVRANAVSDMNDVVSIRIQLVIRSMQNNVADVATPYFFNGQTIIPTDKRLRRVYTSTIVLRNRVP
jgi:type IV pilus assembly protein PilW